MKLTLKAARVNAGLVQKDLAQKMGVTKAAVSLWENGQTQMTAQQFQQFCEITGVGMGDILLPKMLSKTCQKKRRTRKEV